MRTQPVAILLLLLSFPLLSQLYFGAISSELNSRTSGTVRPEQIAKPNLARFTGVLADSTAFFYQTSVKL
jgi:hypothetical protein